MSRPLLSVCLITYNQENYIQKAIESVFAQETNFNIEFIISNDCSPDNSHEKIEEIIKKAPKNFEINYFNHQNNLGAMKNFETENADPAPIINAHIRKRSLFSKRNIRSFIVYFLLI